MSRSKVSVLVDPRTDTLTARRKNAFCWSSVIAGDDSLVTIVHRTLTRQIMAVEVLNATDAEPWQWFDLPDRRCFPPDLVDAIDGWFLNQHNR